jgi:hypothetical protein
LVGNGWFVILSEQLSATLCLSQLLQRKDTMLKTIAAPAPELVNFLEGREVWRMLEGSGISHLT